MEKLNIAQSYCLPRMIWTTYKLFGETIIQEARLIEITLDKNGIKKCDYQTSNGNSKYVWVRDYLDDTNLFETLEQAIESVEDGNYSIKYFV
jgi:hypothetical protein